MPDGATDKALTLIETINAPGFGPPLHRHPEAEIFRVLEGRYLYEVDGRRFQVGAGDVVSIPGGAAHAFVNVTDRPARQYIAIVPGLDAKGFFMGLAEVMKDGRPDVAALNAFAKAWGSSFSVLPSCRNLQSRRRATSSMRWLAPFFRIRLARWRVGRMLSRRFTRLMRFHRPSATSMASSSGDFGIAPEIGQGIAERGVAQAQEAVHVPAVQVVLVGVDIDREIEEIGHERNRHAVLRHAGRLEDVEALDDEDVRPVDHLLLARHHVVDQVRVERRAARCACRP